MASPTIESLCCLKTADGLAKTLLVDTHTLSYNLVSIFASLLGVAGALYQIFKKEPVMMRRNFQNGFANQLGIRGKKIIKWLAVSDLMAASGIFVRSVSWIADKTFGSTGEDGLASQVFCVSTSAWIHYFYTVTYAWTFIYALDMKYALEGRTISFIIYHSIAWIFPALLSTTGLLFLYLPDFNCYSMLVNPYVRFLPNYLSTFVPILFVMFSNPFLYFISFSSVEKLLPVFTGRYTETERKIFLDFRMKFLLINLGFFVCWFPNILNGILIWTAWDSLPGVVISIVWYAMAILNPLQAVINCFVYRDRTNGPAESWRRLWVPSQVDFPTRDELTSSSDDDEYDEVVHYDSSDFSLYGKLIDASKRSFKTIANDSRLTDSQTKPPNSMTLSSDALRKTLNATSLTPDSLAFAKRNNFRLNEKSPLVYPTLNWSYGMSN